MIFKNNFCMRLIFLLFGIILFGSPKAQTPNQNLKKYWYYKDRMKHYFVVPGDCYGCSMPLSTRNRTYLNSQNDPINLNIADGGDSPDNIGYYIGQLAAEYKLLIDNNQIIESEKTLEELFYAINQINYSDACEGHWPWNLLGLGLNDKIDGGCMRDYGDKKMLEDKLGPGMEIDYPGQIAYGFSDGTPMSFDNIDSPFNDAFDITSPPTYCKHFFNSIDHHTYLLLGLALVEKLIPEGTTFNGRYFLDGKTADFKLESKLIAARFWSYWYRNNWRIVFPDGSKFPLKPDPATCPNQNPSFNHFGQYAGLLSFPFTQAVERVIGGDLFNANIVSFLLEHYDASEAQSILGISAADLGYDIGNQHPLLDLYNLWGLSLSDLEGVIASIFSADFIQQVGVNAISNLTSERLYYLMFATNASAVNEITHSVVLNLECVADIFHRQVVDVFTTLTATGAALGANIGAVGGGVLSLASIESGVYYTSKTFDWHPFYTTLHKVLHPNAAIIRASENLCEEFLDGAPCLGTFDYLEGEAGVGLNSGANGWANKRRWSATKEEQNGIIANTYGTYAGLDYMLYFNLYCLRESDYINSYANTHTNIHVNYDLPILQTITIVNGPCIPPIIAGVTNSKSSNSCVDPVCIPALITGDIITANKKIGVNIITHQNVVSVGEQSFTTIIPINQLSPCGSGKVEFKATNSIILEPGFETESGVEFLAQIAPIKCDNVGNYYKVKKKKKLESEDNTWILFPPNKTVVSTVEQEENLISNITTTFDEENTKKNNLPNNTRNKTTSPYFNIKPNPNKGSFIVNANFKNPATISIYDITGRSVFYKENVMLNGDYPLSLNAIEKGMYNLKVSDGVTTKVLPLVIE